MRYLKHTVINTMRFTGNGPAAVHTATTEVHLHNSLNNLETSKDRTMGVRSKLNLDRSV